MNGTRADRNVAMYSNELCAEARYCTLKFLEQYRPYARIIEEIIKFTIDYGVLGLTSL